MTGKPPPMPEFDVPIAAPESGRLTTVWWEWLQRYLRWSEACCEAGSGDGDGGPVDWDDVTDKPATFPPTLPIAESDVTNLVTDLAAKAPLASPAFTGNPTAPTPTVGDNDTSIATTAFVAAAVATGGGAFLPLTGGTLSGALTVSSGGITINGSGTQFTVTSGNINVGGATTTTTLSVNGQATITGGGLNFATWGTNNYLTYTSGANSFSLGHASVGLSSMNVLPATQRHLFAFAGTTIYSMDTAFFFPNTGTPTLGTSSFKWGQIYSTVGTISTSDANLKQDIRTLTAQEMTVARALKGIVRAYRVRDEVKKDPDAKIHVGVIAQQVKAVFDANGLDIHAYAFYEENTMVIDRYDEETSSWVQIPTSRIERSIKYDELQCWILAALLELLP